MRWWQRQRPSRPSSLGRNSLHKTFIRTGKDTAAKRWVQSNKKWYCDIVELSLLASQRTTYKQSYLELWLQVPRWDS